ncbi:Na+/H+ antiporter NhaA [Alloscardovia macacae]|uniref:Na(+)/H(+) antiporter NhaA n=1 Tax=Alloscardovia macacae TaxID=1160091 RepID=A0A261F554_9BIFI|nr:Na+/H+ antiporter NhaA [Alloscardovia macacae]OZG54205.1 sodium:proton antiporter [Alloscardovia macacae]
MAENARGSEQKHQNKTKILSGGDSWWNSFIANAKRISESDRTSGLIMLGFAFVGFLLANLPFTFHVFESIREFVISVPLLHIHLTVDEWVQDGVLTIFFLVVGLDLKQELTTGSLSNPRAAAVPMIAAVGGMIAPALIFLAVTFGWASVTGGVETVANGQVFPFDVVSHGWAIPSATDIAFSLAVLALFAKALPGVLRAFLMTLATVDDLLGIIVIALFFSELHNGWWACGIIIGAAVWTWSIRRDTVPWALVILAGFVMWYSMHELGVHPTLSGVLAGLLTPSRPLGSEHDARAARYLHKLEPLSALIALPIFALFATGIHFDVLSWNLFTSPLVIAVIAALVIGKPVGILCSSCFSTHILKLKLAAGLRVRDLLPISAACGIGFTVSFLIASLAYHQAELSNEARFGVLIGSLLSACIAAYLLQRQSNAYARKSQIKTVSNQSVSSTRKVG